MERVRAAMSRPSTRLILIAALLGLVLRLGTAWVSRSVPVLNGVPDTGAYVALGRAWGAGHVQRVGGQFDHYWPPGYPMFVGSVAWARHLITGETPLADFRKWVAVAQAFTGAWLVAVVGWFGRRIANAVVGVVAAFTVAIWPGLVIASGNIMSEATFTPLFFTSVALVGTRRRTAGVLLGLAILTRPVAIVAMPLLLIKGRREFAAAVFAVLALWVAVLAGSGAITPPREGVLAMCRGNHPGVTAAGADPHDYCHTDPASVARHWISGHLTALPGLAARRIGFTTSADTYGLLEYPGPGHPYRLPVDRALLVGICGAWWFPARVLAITGAVVGWRRFEAFQWVIPVGLLLLIGPLVTAGDPRYHDTLDPFMALCIGAAVWFGWSWLNARRAGHPEG